MSDHSPTPPPPRPTPAAGQPHKPYELKRTVGRIAWVSASVVLLLGVLAFASGRGFSLSASEGGPTVKVDPPLAAGQASREQIEDSQGELEAAVVRANEEITRDTSTASPASINIEGEWYVASAIGAYVIDQVGGAATITEFDGFGRRPAQMTRLS